MIDRFTDKYRFLSNFWPCEIEYEGILYPSNEHFYVAMKTIEPELRKEISEVETAGKVKRFGRKMEIRDDWDDVKLQVMEYGLRQKFSKEPLRTMLLETGDEEIIEGNTWGDVFWGVDLNTGEGQNNLGRLLMKLRSEL